MKMRICALNVSVQVVVLFLAANVAANGTTLLRLSLAQMASTAQAIVRARCVGNTTGWDAGEIWTFSSFEAEEVWRGAVPVQFTVRLLGGRAGSLTSKVSGVPRFHAGEDVVLFLEPTQRGDFSVVSWSQGTFRIRRDLAMGSENVTQDTATFSTFDPASRRFEAAGIRSVPLEDFRARVYAALRAEASRKP
jgi:hypothetical protein